MEEKLTTLEKYGYIYHMVGMNPITRKELREKIKKDSPKMSETTLKKYSDAPFDGAYPMFVVKDDKATLDITAFRSFIEELCKYVGTDAAVLFTGPAPAPGGRKGDNPQIAKVPNKAENPQILIERKKNTELSKQIADLEKQIEELRLENQKIVADSVLANMSKEVNISTVRVFGKAVEEDIFLHNVSDVLGEVRDVSKVGGIRQSFYVKDSDKAKELTVQNARSKVAEILFRSKFFEKLFRDSCAYEKKVSGNLNTGKITQEEYDEYYPLDGLEDSYYSVFVNVDLNKAATTSGRALGSEEAIAKYIADMLLLESDNVFNIRYTGTTKTSGETFYEFRCYR